MPLGESSPAARAAGSKLAARRGGTYERYERESAATP